MNENKIKRVIDRSKMEVGSNLSSWAEGENFRIERATDSFMWDILKGEAELQIGINRESRRVSFGLFLKKYYYPKKSEIEAQKKKVEKLKSEMCRIVKDIKALEMYFRYKPIIEGYKRYGLDNLNPNELMQYKSDLAKYNYAITRINEIKSKGGSLSLNQLRADLEKLKVERKKESLNLTRARLEFEDFENAKYNYNTGFNLMSGISDEEALAALAQEQEKERKALEKKAKVKKLFHLK